MDFISLSRGGKFDDAKQPKVGEAAYPYTGRSGYECMPSYYSDRHGFLGRNLARERRDPRGGACRRARDAHRRRRWHPQLRAGRSECSSGRTADLVSLARQALADPDWFRKVRLGYGDAVRLCMYTNYCEALDQRHREVTCELWDREGVGSPGVAVATDGKRRLVAPPWEKKPE